MAGRAWMQGSQARVLQIQRGNQERFAPGAGKSEHEADKGQRGGRWHGTHEEPTLWSNGVVMITAQAWRIIQVTGLRLVAAVAPWHCLTLSDLACQCF